jgi:hypothetical protein
MLVELWKLAAVAGLVEYSFSGLFITPVSLLPTGADFTGHFILLEIRSAGSEEEEERVSGKRKRVGRSVS